MVQGQSLAILQQFEIVCDLYTDCCVTLYEGKHAVQKQFAAFQISELSVRVVVIIENDLEETKIVAHLH